MGNEDFLLKDSQDYEDVVNPLSDVSGTAQEDKVEQETYAVSHVASSRPTVPKPPALNPIHPHIAPINPLKVHREGSKV